MFSKNRAVPAVGPTVGPAGAAARRARILLATAGALALTAGAAALTRSLGRDPEPEHVATGVPHTVGRVGAAGAVTGPAGPTGSPDVGSAQPSGSV